MEEDEARDSITCSLPVMWEHVPVVPSHSSPPLTSVHKDRPPHAKESLTLLIREAKRVAEYPELSTPW
ncbi:unnamed protein product [Lota lota]